MYMYDVMMCCRSWDAYARPGSGGWCTDDVTASWYGADHAGGHGTAGVHGSRPQWAGADAEHDDDATR